jgi:hypothetical protein
VEKEWHIAGAEANLTRRRGQESIRFEPGKPKEQRNSDLGEMPADHNRGTIKPTMQAITMSTPFSIFA